MTVIDKALMYAPEFRSTLLKDGGYLLWTPTHACTFAVQMSKGEITRVSCFQNGHDMTMREAAQYTLILSQLMGYYAPYPEEFPDIYTATSTLSMSLGEPFVKMLVLMLEKYDKDTGLYVETWVKEIAASLGKVVLRPTGVQ